jgi:hypothetical protein
MIKLLLLLERSSHKAKISVAIDISCSVTLVE